MGELSGEAKVVSAPGYCRGCGYMLRGLAEARCPECGRGFDPHDPRTYTGRPNWLRWRRRLARVGVALLAAVLAYGGWVWWLYHEWSREQPAVATVLRCGGRVSRYQAGSPAMKKLLPQRLHYLLERVYAVFLDKGKISDDEMAALGAMKELRSANLILNPITAKGVAHLKGLGHLEWLSLDGTRVDDSAMAHVAALRGLRMLGLNGTRITDAGVAQLSGLDRMELLFLDGTAITDAGLGHLDGMQRLQKLYVRDTAATEGMALRLKARPAMQELLYGPMRRRLPAATKRAE